MWDDVIVGAGSSGAVLASRLSERPDRRVLLLEAGVDDAGLTESARTWDRPVLSGRNWDYEAWVGTAGEGRRVPYCVGKVIGGSSAVNGAMALRGLPADFDGWAAAGNPEWVWDKVLPHFTRMEADADFKGPSHGTDGPVPIERLTSDDFNAMAIAFEHCCRSFGVPDLPDLNGGQGIGVGKLPTNSVGGGRMSTAETHLALAYGRPNLTVWPQSHVTRVLITERRAVGVEVLREGRLHEVPAGQVTLCAGAINTPLILQRSGIGRAGTLHAMGIRPVADLPGVGENLIDHATVAIWALPKPGLCDEAGPWHSMLARVASTGSRPDFNLFLVNNVAATAIAGGGGAPELTSILGDRTAISIFAMLLTPTSRGSVSLRDTLPRTAPMIALRLASAPSDVERLMWGARLAWSLVRSSPLAELLDRVLVWTDRMVRDDALLRRTVKRFVAPTWHPVGTAAMGPSSDDMAVVDQYCRVRQVRDLRVADASVMPSIPSAPTNLSCVMLAERVAEWMA